MPVYLMKASPGAVDLSVSTYSLFLKQLQVRWVGPWISRLGITKSGVNWGSCGSVDTIMVSVQSVDALEVYANTCFMILVYVKHASKWHFHLCQLVHLNFLDCRLSRFLLHARQVALSSRSPIKVLHSPLFHRVFGPAFLRSTSRLSLFQNASSNCFVLPITRDHVPILQWCQNQVSVCDGNSERALNSAPNRSGVSGALQIRLSFHPASVFEACLRHVGSIRYRFAVKHRKV